MDKDTLKSLQTKTQSGEYWHVAVGLSQRAINKGLEELFALNPEMSEMYSVDDRTGTIDAKLRPPQVVIPGGKASSADRLKVFFQLRFESGRMLDSYGEVLVEDLSNWTIASALDLNPEKVVIQDDMTAEQKEALKMKAAISLQSNVLGDYSIERLYLKLSSKQLKSPYRPGSAFISTNPTRLGIQWHDIDKDNTYCGLDASGKQIPFSQWANEDFSRYTRLTTWIGQWAAEQDRVGRNIIGLSFKILSG